MSKKENGLPQPKKVKCFQCAGDFYIKFVVPHKNYSQKNNWGYWTGTKSSRQICDGCLLKFYYDKEVYWTTITDLRVRNKLRSYIYSGIIQ